MEGTTTRAFFFMATLQVPDPRGIRVVNVWGNAEFRQGVTRQETITWFNQTYLPQEGLAGANIMFWQCEPDAYGVA